MASIVVPLDGSSFAERALRPACALAARTAGWRVVLVHCATDEAAAMRSHLEGRAALFTDLVDVEVRIVHEADAAEAILRAATEGDESLLCMATHGHGGLRSVVLGSVAEQVLCRAEQPLLLIGPGCRNVVLPGERGRMLVCSDGSPFADSVVPAAASWSIRFGLEPWVAEVVGPDENVAYPDDPVQHRGAEEASARLAALAERLGSLGAPAGHEVLHGTPTSRSITDCAERLPAAVIAMATHGRTGLARTAVGSVAAEVVRHAPCPVLTARPPVGT